jgi:hypothetical protein
MGLVTAAINGGGDVLSGDSWAQRERIAEIQRAIQGRGPDLLYVAIENLVNYDLRVNKNPYKYKLPKASLLQLAPGA